MASGEAGDLERFVQAQASVYDDVVAELGAGCKRTHWMWFVFPQLKELGRSPTAAFYGIDGLDEALAYWRHPVLGPRLKRCVERVLQAQGTAHQIFGSPDDLKFKSSLTLFEVAAPDEPIFATALGRFYGGARDERTLELLAARTKR